MFFLNPKTYGTCIPQGAATTFQASRGKMHPKSHKTTQTGNVSTFSSDKIPQKPQLPLPLGKVGDYMQYIPQCYRATLYETKLDNLFCAMPKHAHTKLHVMTYYVPC